MTQENRNQKTVVVLRIGRSGTSVTVGILNILGVDLEAEPTQTVTNPKGVF